MRDMTPTETHFVKGMLTHRMNELQKFMASCSKQCRVVLGAVTNKDGFNNSYYLMKEKRDG